MPQASRLRGTRVHRHHHVCDERHRLTVTTQESAWSPERQEDQHRGGRAAGTGITRSFDLSRAPSPGTSLFTSSGVQRLVEPSDDGREPKPYFCSTPPEVGGLRKE